MTDTPRAALLAEMRSAATAVYIELEKSVADDVSGLLTRAAAEIRALEAKVREEQYVNQRMCDTQLMMQEEHAAQLAALREDRERERAALERYGQHTLDCPAHPTFPHIGLSIEGHDEKCYCGWDAALAARQAGRTEG